MRVPRHVLVGSALLFVPALLRASEPASGGLLDINVTLLIQAVNYVVFVLLMDALLFRPVIAHLDARRRRISEAETMAEEADKKTQEAERRRRRALDKALAEATVERSKVTGEAVDEYQRIVHQARLMADAKVQEARDLFQTEADRVGEQMAGDVGELAELVKQKLLVVSGGSSATGFGGDS